MSLWSGKTESAVDSDLSDGISFDSIASGDYVVRISGMVTGPKFHTFVYGGYAGGFDIAPSIPEPEAWALFVAGLLAVWQITRRRNP